MPGDPNKLSQFWQELKRRKVIKVIAMYAGVAYILIELASNVAEPLHLPEWIPTFVILLLVIGFPITIILSWIFDVTPEGIKKIIIIWVGVDIGIGISIGIGVDVNNVVKFLFARNIFLEKFARCPKSDINRFFRNVCFKDYRPFVFGRIAFLKI